MPRKFCSLESNLLFWPVGCTFGRKLGDSLILNFVVRLMSGLLPSLFPRATLGTNFIEGHPKLYFGG